MDNISTLPGKLLILVYGLEKQRKISMVQKAQLKGKFEASQI